MEKLKDTFGMVIYILLFALYISGVIHSFNKHTDGVLTLFFFPWGWYRGAEMIWHDDYAGVEWDKKLNNDIKTCYYFFNKYTEKDANVYELNKDMEKFSKEISRYPEEKIVLLKNGVSDYYNYTLSFVNDINDYTANKDIRKTFRFSDRTNEYGKKYKEHLTTEEADIVSKETKAIEEKMRLSENEFGEKEKELIEMYMNMVKIKFKEVYKNIFNEEFKE